MKITPIEVKVVKDYTITLSERELQILAAICGNISGLAGSPVKNCASKFASMVMDMGLYDYAIKKIHIATDMEVR
jgi:hypothetical protein